MADELVLYTSAEVAELLRMNHQVIQRKLQAGEIPGYRIGREWRVERDQLRAWLDSRSNQRQHDVERWFDDTGALRAMPARQSRRRAVLQRLLEPFVPDRVYKEDEVNAILRRYHSDVAALRRELVSEHLLVRTRDGVYKLSASREPVLRRR